MQSNPLSLLSTYRAQLMGLASLWVVVYHANLGRVIPFEPLAFLCHVGYGGVDIFMFLSGFGLYYSTCKATTLKQFYIRRFSRILPTYFIIVLFNAVLLYFIQSERVATSLQNMLLQLSTLDFWLYGEVLFWYVPSCLVLYILFPFYIKLFHKSKVVSTIVAVLFGLCLSLFIGITSGDKYDFRILFSSRIPIFAIGILIGYLSLNNKTITKAKVLICSFVGVIVGFAALYYMVYHNEYLGFRLGGLYYVFILIAPGLAFLLSSGLDLLKKLTTIPQKGIAILGSMSLELYLIHVALFSERERFAQLFGLNTQVTLLILFAVSLILSYFLCLFTNCLADRINKKFV